jgi:hypothetical protein
VCSMHTLNEAFTKFHHCLCHHYVNVGCFDRNIVIWFIILTTVNFVC